VSGAPTSGSKVTCSSPGRRVVD